jgi:hypothetical protein
VSSAQNFLLSQMEWHIVSHNHFVCRPSKLPEEDAEGHFSSSLDLSEIRLNFDLEESEMRIFSEDETLISTSMGSGSIMSHASPRVASACRVRQQMVSVRMTIQWLTWYNMRTEVQLLAIVPGECVINVVTFRGVQLLSM